MEQFGSAITSDIDPDLIIAVLGDVKKIIHERRPELMHIDCWLQPVTGLPVALFTEMIKDPLAGYWIFVSVSDLVSAVIRNKNDKRLFCFNVVWE